MRLWTRVWTWITSDTSGERSLSGFSDSSLEAEELDGFTAQGGDRFTVPADSTATLRFPTNMTTAAGVWLSTTADLSMVLNGGADIFVLTVPAGASAARFYIDAPITQIDVTNASTTLDALVDFRVWA